MFVCAQLELAEEQTAVKLQCAVRSDCLALSEITTLRHHGNLQWMKGELLERQAANGSFS